MILVAGLGNPGPRYASTRHNVGFMALDAWAVSASPGGEWRNEGKSQCLRIPLKDDVFLLAKPQSFMNLSGEALLPLLSFFKIPPAQLVVITDDVTLPFGSLRIRDKGGHGGHNGLRNIIDHVGENFPRIRVGVGLCPPGWDMADFVLASITGPQRASLSEALAIVPAAILTGIQSGWDKAANKYNRRLPASE